MESPRDGRARAMSPELEVLLAVVAMGGGAVFLLLKLAKAAVRWSQPTSVMLAAQRLGMQRSVLTSPHAGVADGVPLRLSATQLQTAPGVLFPGIEMRDGPRTEFDQRRATPTGDEGFDRQMLVIGDEEQIAAALSAPVRRRLRGAAGADGIRLELVQHATILSVPVAGQSAERIEELAARLAVQAKELEVKDVVVALAANALLDPILEVRMRCLKLLIARHRDDPRTAEALEAALRSDQFPLRLLACRALGERGLISLRALALSERATWSTDAEPGAVDQPAAALSVYCAEANEQPARELLEVGLHRRPELADAAARAIPRWRERFPDAPCESLQAALGKAARDLLQQAPFHDAELHARLGVSLAQALATFPGDDSETSLLALLGHRREEVQHAAAAALGAIGTIRAVEPLLALPSGPLHRGLAQEAQTAVRAIQSRLGPAEAGSLSLTESQPSEGALSLPDPKPQNESP